MLQKLCGQMGAKQTSRLTKQEAVTFLRKKLNVPAHFRKIFTKIWGASGIVQTKKSSSSLHTTVHLQTYYCTSVNKHEISEDFMKL